MVTFQSIKEYTRVNLVSNSASLSGENQVDGLPPALHTEAVGDPHGGWGSAPIGTIEVRKLKIERNYEFT